MTTTSLLAILAVLIPMALQGAMLIRVLLRPHREPSARMAWVVVLFTLPLLGIIAYLLFGEANIGRTRTARLRAAHERMPSLRGIEGAQALLAPTIPERYRHLFRVGESISGLPVVGGNRGALMADSNASIDALVADIDAARDHVHVLFYIWLADNNGTRVAEALMRAAGRGVVCRAMADDLGSRKLFKSELWRRMRTAGVHLARALPVGNPLLRPLSGRIDLRNHRKIVVIDDDITYCGSQNCADPEFLIKRKYAPWVDLMMRFEGPVARANQALFASHWTAQTGEDLDLLLSRPLAAKAAPGVPAQVIGTGPTVRWSAMPQVFEELIYSARRELIITTPYYVPDESMQSALCASARRGVATTIVFPARNDSWVVAAASRSYYRDLLLAGVRILEYPKGLLHTKSLTLDGEVTLIGSANMDRRSFDLNYENNILFVDPDLTAEVRRRQQDYIADSAPLAVETVEAWSWRRRLWHNAIAMLGPVL